MSIARLPLADVVRRAYPQRVGVPGRVDHGRFVEAHEPRRPPGEGGRGVHRRRRVARANRGAPACRCSAARRTPTTSRRSRRCTPPRTRGSPRARRRSRPRDHGDTRPSRRSSRCRRRSSRSRGTSAPRAHRGTPAGARACSSSGSRPRHAPSGLVPALPDGSPGADRRAPGCPRPPIRIPFAGWGARSYSHPVCPALGGWPPSCSCPPRRCCSSASGALADHCPPIDNPDPIPGQNTTYCHTPKPTEEPEPTRHPSPRRRRSRQRLLRRSRPGPADPGASRPDQSEHARADAVRPHRGSERGSARDAADRRRRTARRPDELRGRRANGGRVELDLRLHLRLHRRRLRGSRVVGPAQAPPPADLRLTPSTAPQSTPGTTFARPATAGRRTGSTNDPRVVRSSRTSRTTSVVRSPRKRVCPAARHPFGTSISMSAKSGCATVAAARRAGRRARRPRPTTARPIDVAASHVYPRPRRRARSSTGRPGTGPRALATARDRRRRSSAAAGRRSALG